MENNVIESIKKFINGGWKSFTVGNVLRIAFLIVVLLFALAIVMTMFKWVFGIGGDTYNNGNNHVSFSKVMTQPGMLIERVEEAVMGSSSQSYNSTAGYGGYGDDVEEGMMRVGAPVADMDMDMYYPELASAEAEDFETREYDANYEKRNIESVCSQFEDLKPLEYVVFENANVSEEYCHFRFKVEVEKEGEVIALIEDLDPEDFNARTFTIEPTITNNTNEVEILERKLAMLDGLLVSARTKYAALQIGGDSGALVEAINNEINLIERITTQKLSVQGRIDRLTNSTSVQSERIDYSQFNISVRERKLVDWSAIGEQWKYAFERFISEISDLVQDVTIGLVVFILALVKFFVFLTVGVLGLITVAKFLWTMGRKIWKS